MLSFCKTEEVPMSKVVVKSQSELEQKSNKSKNFKEKQLWIKIDNAKEVEQLLEEGADPNYTITEGKWRGWTPLMYAVYKNLVKVVYLLLKKGANPNQIFPIGNSNLFMGVNWEGWSLFAYSIRGPARFEIANLLLSAGATANKSLSDCRFLSGELEEIAICFREMTIYRTTPLILDYFKSVGLSSLPILSSARRYMFSTNTYGWPLLAVAVFHNNYVVTRIIVDSDPSADLSKLTMLNDKSTSIIEYATKNEYWDIVALLNKHEKTRKENEAKKQLEASREQKSILSTQSIPALETEQTLFTAAEKGNLAQIEELKRQGIALNVKSKDGRTALHYAATGGAGREILDIFTKEGKCDIDQVDKDGETPLFKAVIARHLATVNVLLMYRPDLTKKFNVRKVLENPPTLIHPLTLSATLEYEQAILEFEEKEIPRDNDCGYHVIEASRAEVADALLALAGNEPDRDYLAPEIRNFFLEGHLSEHSEKIKKVYDEWKSADEKGQANHFVREVNEKLSKKNPEFKHLPPKELTKFLVDKAEYATEFAALQRIQEIDKQITELCRSEEIFKLYVSLGKDKTRKLWLGQNSICLFARIKNYNFYIWVRKQSNPRELQLVTHQTVATPTKTIHAIFVDGYNHYNKLEVRKHRQLLADKDKLHQTKHKREISVELERAVEASPTIENLTIFAYVIKYATVPQDLEILRSLLSNRSLNDKLPGEDLPPLTLAAQLGNVFVIKYLTQEMGAEINLHGDYPNPLTCAVLSGQKNAVAELLMLGAQFDPKTEDGQAILMLLEQANLAISMKEEIRKQLFSHVEHQANFQKSTASLANAIFIALFADTIGLQKGQQTKSDVLSELMRLVLIAMPDDTSGLLRRVRYEKLQKEAKEHSQNEKHFVSFVRTALMHRGIEVTTKEWRDVINKDKGKQEEFKQEFQKAIKDYMSKPKEFAWVENIVNQVIIRSKDSALQINIKKIISDVLAKNQFICGYLARLNEQKDEVKQRESVERKLVEFLQTEINFSLDEHDDIEANDRATFYRYRIENALDRWLFDQKCLPDEEAKAFEIANRLVTKLIPYKKGDSGMVPKKEGLARHIIKNALVGHEILDFLLEHPSKESMFIDELFNFLNSERKKLFKNQDRLDKVSKSFLNYEQYRMELNGELYRLLSSLRLDDSRFSKLSVVKGRPKFEDIDAPKEQEVKTSSTVTITLEHPNLRTFVEKLSKSLQNSLHDDRVIYQGKAGRRKDNLDRAIEVGAGAVDATGNAMTSLVVNAARVGIGSVRDLYTDMYAARSKDYGDGNIARFAEKAAKLVALRYKWQIIQLNLTDADGVEGLANYFHNKAMDAVHISAKFKGLKEFWQWICGDIATLSPEDKLYLAMISNSGQSNVFLRKTDETIMGEHWDAKELVLECGIIIKGKTYKRATNSKHSKYGFCFSDDEREIKQHKLCLCSDYDFNWMIKMPASVEEKSSRILTP